jgi:hypothetical protein
MISSAQSPGLPSRARRQCAHNGSRDRAGKKQELEIKLNVLTASLSIGAGRLSDEYGICYKSSGKAIV